MARFSQRMGLRPVRDAVQVDTVDPDLRAALWNAMGKHCFPRPSEHIGIGKLPIRDVVPDHRDLVNKLCLDFLHWPYDDVDMWEDVRARLKKHFFSCEWFEVLDLVEYAAGVRLDQALLWQRYPASNPFVQLCSRVLKQHQSAYRFVGRNLVRVTSEQEVAGIEHALELAEPIQPVRDHLRRALALLSDRKSPDYRNSMKESISAVEALCKLIAGRPKATLGSALNAIQKSGNVDIHSDLKDALHKLYGYSSDADGIRHALKEAPTVDHEDAWFMLTTCSGFVSYLLAKAKKAGITL